MMFIDRFYGMFITAAIAPIEVLAGMNLNLIERHRSPHRALKINAGGSANVRGSGAAKWIAFAARETGVTGNSSVGIHASLNLTLFYKATR
jgi:hypothetical protein